jgi:hypothetical protein
MLTNHSHIFGPQIPKGNGFILHARRLEFITILKNSQNYLPPYVNKLNPENCNFPDDDSYMVEDYYNDLSSAFCNYFNGSLPNNQAVKSIFLNGELKDSPFYKASGNNLIII